MLFFAQQCLNGLHIGAIYALLAFGYALINGVLHRTNLAHGAIFGFTGQLFILIAVFGWRVLWLTLPATLALALFAALLYAALIAAMLSRSVFERLAARSANTIVAATLGVSLVLMELGRIAADTHDFWLPPLLSSPIVFAGDARYRVTLTVMQAVNGLASALAVAVAARAMARTAFGRRWQAVSDDLAAAAMCGVDIALVFRQTVVAGGLLAGLSGILAALYFGNIGFGAGMVFGLKILFVTAVGGYRAPARAAFGGLLFGIAESLWAGYFPIEWRDAWILAFLVALLILRPRADAEAARGGR